MEKGGTFSLMPCGTASSDDKMMGIVMVLKMINMIVPSWCYK